MESRGIPSISMARVPVPAIKMAEAAHHFFACIFCHFKIQCQMGMYILDGFANFKFHHQFLRIN